MSSSSTSPQWEHEVFVSFRGTDERCKFISHLLRQLKEKGLNYFDDEDPDHAGRKIEDKIFSAIHHARVALVVLSKDYAGSTWCLKELVEILRCNSELENHNLVVIPIFYDVDPADVKNLTTKSKFGQAFHLLCENVENVEQKQIWMNALAKVKKISGFVSNNFRKEVDLLDVIFQSLYKQIYQTQSLDFVRNAIGADRLAGDVIPLLRIDKKDVRMIGISGTEGIGKTTVAGAVCKGTLGKFEHFIFLDKVGEAKHYDCVGLQKKLIRNLIKVNGWTPYDDFHGNIKVIKSNLRRKKILLVLDGVTKKEQMEYFGAKNRKLFGSGSRILITTSDRNLLNDLKVDDKYIVEGLNWDEAFRLFCRHAFESEEPQQGDEELSRHLAHYAGGHPLALEKWGFFLNKRSKDKWRKLSDQLVKSPHLNSVGADFGSERIFKEYPFKVVGPCGGDRSTDTWKDEGYTDVREIVVGFDSEAIKFITILYDRYGCPCKQVTHGTRGGETSTIKIKYPREYLTSISGHTKEVYEGTILQSLTFHTNRGKRAPIGKDNEGRKFSFPYTGGKIIGFHGSCNGSRLESIGAFYEPIPHTYPVKVFGPFGGEGKNSWDFGDIKGIDIHYAAFIKSTAFKVNEATSSEPKTIYGGNGRENIFKVKLENGEYITSFSGYLEKAKGGRILINSLAFRTNKRILGPIGREEGTHFFLPSVDGKVIGFFGRSDDYLESIGARVELYSNKLYPFKSVGLFGSSKESNWDDGNDHTNVREILVEFEPREGTYIRSITFRYEVKNERSRRSERHGDITGKKVDPIKIDADEYLTSISGYYTDVGITSLAFQTTKKRITPATSLKLQTKKKTIGPIREEKVWHFSSPATGGKIVGFYGRSGENLEAIGAYFEPILDLYPVKSIGPFGGPVGNPWDDGKFDGVRGIEVMHNPDIRYIRFAYDSSGEQIWSDMHGCNTNGDYTKEEKGMLDYPQEYLTSISGYTREDDVIQSLTFYSNRRTLGPYGKEEGKKGKYFWYPSTGSRIVGFYGTCGETLNSIGVYAKPIPHMCPFKTVGPFGGSGGTPWDDGVHTDVRGFRISFGNEIKAIGIAYDNNGSFVSASEHGSGSRHVLGLKSGERSKDKYKEVLLDYPKERLISISVWVDKDDDNGQTIVRDLQIFTTKETGTYGPFVPVPRPKRAELTRFRIPSKQDGGRIVGFFGRAGTCLNSIGARLESY